MDTKIRNIILDFTIITLGTILTALGIALFLDPFAVIAGGVSGLAIVMKHLFGWWVGVQMLIYNGILFALAVLLLGKSFGVKTVYSAVLLSVFIDIFEHVFHMDKLIKDILEKSNPHIDYLLLAAIYGGLLTGIGIGLVIWRGATTGGTDIIAMIINKYLHISPGIGLMSVDTSITLLAFLLNPILPMYGLLTVFATSKLIDAVIDGLSTTRTFIIISEKYDSIRRKILEEMERGVTILKGKGGYTLEDKEILLVTISRNEVGKLRSIIKEEDNLAFIIELQNSETYGYGFKKIT